MEVVGILALLGMLIFACVCAAKFSKVNQDYLNEINRLNNEKLKRDKQMKIYLESLSDKGRAKYDKIMENPVPKKTVVKAPVPKTAEQMAYEREMEREYREKQEMVDSIMEKVKNQPSGNIFADTFFDAWENVQAENRARESYNNRSILERKLNYQRDICAIKDALLSGGDRDAYNKIFGNKK